MRHIVAPPLTLGPGLGFSPTKGPLGLGLNRIANDNNFFNLREKGNTRVPGKGTDIHSTDGIEHLRFPFQFSLCLIIAQRNGKVKKKGM